MADALTVMLGQMLVKAFGDDDDRAFGWWDERFGEDTFIKPPKPYTKVEGDPMSGHAGIANWVNASPRKVDAHLMGEDGLPRLTDFPVDQDFVVPEFADLKDTLHPLDANLKPDQFAHFGKPSKMPGPSLFDVPMRTCIYHKRGNPDYACGHCYADYLHYRMNNTQTSLWRTFDRLHNNPVALTAAYMQTARPMAALMRERRTDDLFGRFSAAGDKQGIGHFAAQDKVAEANPDMTFWDATRQYDMLQDFLDARGWNDDAVSSNMNINVSLPGRMLPDQVKPGTTYPMPNGRVIDLHELTQHPAIGMSGFDKMPKGGSSTTVCPVTIPGNPKGCDNAIDPLTGQTKCRNCFRRGSQTMFLENNKPLSGRMPPTLERLIQLQDMRKRGGN